MTFVTQEFACVCSHCFLLVVLECVLFCIIVLAAASHALQNLRRARCSGGESLGLYKREKRSLQPSTSSSVKKVRPVWKHNFVRLSNMDQSISYTSIEEKHRLIRAGLGEKVVEFTDLEITREEFKEILYTVFPPLRDGGGFIFFKCMPNSRKLEVLPSTVLSSPSSLKKLVGSAKTFIKPLQCNLSLNENVCADDEVGIIILSNTFIPIIADRRLSKMW